VATTFKVSFDGIAGIDECPRRRAGKRQRPTWVLGADIGAAEQVCRGARGSDVVVRESESENLDVLFPRCARASSDRICFAP
jgi:hypothetical protein